MKKIGVLIVIGFFLLGCIDKKSPEYRVRQYLTALKNKNFEEAKKYCEKTAVYNLDCALSMGTTDFGVTDIRDIKCTINNNTADCSYCCSHGEPKPQIRLVRENGEWLIVGVKEQCPLDDVPNSDSDSLDNN